MNTITIASISVVMAAALAGVTYHNATRIVRGVEVNTPAGPGVVSTDEMQLAMTKAGPMIGFKVLVTYENGKTCEVGFATKYLTRR